MIELIVLDVDGTMTDGRISYTQSGDEIKSFNVKDGLGIRSWIDLGKKVAIITGRNSEILTRRAEELRISEVHQGIENKEVMLSEILQKYGLKFENVAAIGDDLNDYSMLKRAALSFIPADASQYMQEVADITLKSRGGEGAVREMIDILIQREHLEEKYLSSWQ